MFKKKEEKKIKHKIILIIFILFFSYFFLLFYNVNILKLLPENNNISLLLLNNEKILKENKYLKQKIKEKEIEQKIGEKNCTINNSNGEEQFYYFSILNNIDNDFYNSMKIFTDKKEIDEIFPVLSKNNIAIGLLEKNNDNDIYNIDYFSKINSKNNLFVKNYFNNKEDDVDMSIKFIENEEENNIKTVDENIDDKNSSVSMEGDDLVKEEQIDVLKQEKKFENFEAQAIGYGNGFLYIEVPREYKVSKKSILYFMYGKKYPVAYFLKEESSEQIPIKKVFYKTFENPSALDEVKVKLK